MTASLWLIPHEDSTFNKAIQELISSELPGVFYASLKEKHIFAPHLTLTSGIDPSKTYEADGTSAQEWLDGLSFSKDFKREHNEVIIQLDHLEPGDDYYQKLSIVANPNDNLSLLAAQCRREAVLNTAENGHVDGDPAQKWAKDEFSPHLSLMYGDMPTNEVERKLAQVEMKLGFSIGSLFDCCGGTLSMGGSMVLVDTSKPIEEWKPLARRETDWVMWKMSRTLV